MEIGSKHKIGESGGGRFSRRDFLRLFTAFSAVTAAAAVGVNAPYLFEEDQEGQFPKQEDQKPSEKELEISKSVTTSIKKISAILTLYNDRNQSDELVQYFLNKYNIQESDLIKINQTSENKIDINDVATIFESLENSPLASGIKDLMVEDGEITISSISHFLSLAEAKSSWYNFILENNLGSSILSMGVKGKSALINLNIPTESFEFQASLLSKQEQVQAVSADKAFNYYNEANAPHNSVVNINTNSESRFYQFTLSLEPDKLKPSHFILNRLKNIENNSEKLSPSQSNEFIVLENWIYSEYKENCLLDPKINIEKFNNNILSNLSSESNSTQSLQGRLNTIYSDLVFSVGKEKAIQDIKSILDGSPKTFKEVISTLPPAIKSIFHNKSAQLGEVNSYQMILRNSLVENKLDITKIPSSIVKYSGNLYLEPIVDRKSMEGEYRVSLQTKNSFSAKEVISSLVNDKQSPEEYASAFFGSRKTIVTNSKGEALGTIVDGRVSEPVMAIPQLLLDVLDATEGDRWKDGKSWIKTILKRNAVALVSDEPASGGSDRIMQLTEMIFPSPFDKITSLSDSEINNFPFRRPDLYGVNYLMFKLLPAVRDGLPVEDIYIPHKNLPVGQVVDDSAINRLCAKFESYLIARDFVGKYGKERMDALYIQYVPIGNATGKAAGIQMQGLETGANFYFNKTLGELNIGEISILVGMIQSPLNYGPVKWNGLSWVNNEKVCFERAEKVASLTAEKKGLIKEEIVDSIHSTNFEFTPKNSWLTTISADQLSKIKPGTFDLQGINLDLGINVLREPSDLEYIPKFPKNLELPKRVHKEQFVAENWLKNALGREQLRLATKENSQLANILTEAAIALEESYEDHDKMVLKITALAQKIDPLFQYNYWEGKKLGKKTTEKDIPNQYSKGDPKYELWNSLYELHSSLYWQCGQCAILLNSLQRMSTGLRVPTVFSPGFVKNWMKELDGIGNKPGKDYFTQGDYEIFKIDKKILGINPSEKNPISLFKVGDIVISWRGDDYGHASTVIDIGLDSEEREYLTVVDANYLSDGKIRKQTIWADKLATTLYPGRPNHVGIIRGLNLNHGNQIPLSKSDKTFLDTMVMVNVDGNQAVLPGFEQLYKTENGTLDSLVNPGFAVSTFNENGFKMGLDPTNILGETPISVGNSLKPFVFAFAVLNGIDPKKEISILPGNETLDNSEQFVANSATLGFNLQGVEGTVTLEEALSCGLDIPFQTVFKDLIKSNPDTWSDFQQFLDFFGIPLVDWSGKRIDKPTALGATGRDVLTRLDNLGYALSCILNPETAFGDQNNSNHELLEVFKYTRDVFMSKSIRQNLKIGLHNPIIEEIGDDLSDPSMTNAINDVQFADHNLLWSGTNLGDTNLGLVVKKTDTEGYQVTVSINKGQVLAESSTFAPNLNKINYRASNLGVPGLGLVTAKISTLS